MDEISFMSQARPDTRTRSDADRNEDLCHKVAIAPGRPNKVKYTGAHWSAIDLGRPVFGVWGRVSIRCVNLTGNYLDSGRSGARRNDHANGRDRERASEREEGKPLREIKGEPEAWKRPQANDTNDHAPKFYSRVRLHWSWCWC